MYSRYVKKSVYFDSKIGIDESCNTGYFDYDHATVNHITELKINQ